MEEIEISKLTFLTKFINGFKFRQIEYLLDIYNSNGFNFFEPIKMAFPNGKSTMVTPPIIERHGQNNVVIEGNTRLGYLYRNGYQTCFVIVVQGVKEMLPSEGRFKCNQMLITDSEKTGVARYKDFDYNKYRNVEQGVRDPKTCLK